MAHVWLVLLGWGLDHITIQGIEGQGLSAAPCFAHCQEKLGAGKVGACISSYLPFL
jgi:hypothetical protein